jgi:hypothetical protein
MTTYLGARAAGSALADVNRDHVLDAQDDLRFTNALMNALGPP